MAQSIPLPQELSFTEADVFEVEIHLDLHSPQASLNQSARRAGPEEPVARNAGVCPTLVGPNPPRRSSKIVGYAILSPRLEAVHGRLPSRISLEHVGPHLDQWLRIRTLTTL